jgi:hypothetical protein
MRYARRFKDVGIEAIKQLEEARGRLGLEGLREGKRVDLTRRLMLPGTRCEAMDERVHELKERLRGQIDVVSSPMITHSSHMALWDTTL